MARALGHDPLPGVRQQSQLTRSADHRCFLASRRLGREREQPIGLDRLRLSLQDKRLQSLGLHRAPRQPHRVLADQDLARLRSLLETGGDVDRISCRQALRRPGHDLARADADPTFDTELRKCIAHLDRRAYRPERIVLVDHRHPEHRHHRVADELLHRAPVPLDDRLHPLEVAGQ